MDNALIKEVADQYPWASWAVWDETFPDDGCVEQKPEQLVSFVRKRADDLTPDVVLIGLNRADDLPAPFSNFHAPTRRHYDYRLKEFIQDVRLHRLHAAYMTDLVDKVDPDSANVDVSDDDVNLLLEQLRLLEETTYHLVCFGNKPFNGLVRYFDIDVCTQWPELRYATVTADGLTLNLYRVWFYGLYGANQHKVPVLEQQLKHLNEMFS